jgi:hypothetical protein
MEAQAQTRQHTGAGTGTGTGTNSVTVQVPRVAATRKDTKFGRMGGGVEARQKCGDGVEGTGGGGGGGGSTGPSTHLVHPLAVSQGLIPLHILQDSHALELVGQLIVAATHLQQEVTRGSVGASMHQEHSAV